MNSVNDRLAEALIHTKSIKFGQFRLKLHEKFPDAPLSPIYVDLRILRSFPHEMRLAIRALQYEMNGISFDAIADVPTAGTPFASILSYELKVPMVSPRLDTKSHGTGVVVDGTYKEGWKVLVVDDLITTADSKISVMNTLMSKNMFVRDVLVLLDREQGGMEQLRQLGCQGHSVFKLRSLLDYYLKRGLISVDESSNVLEYLDSVRTA